MYARAVGGEDMFFDAVFVEQRFEMEFYFVADPWICIVKDTVWILQGQDVVADVMPMGDGTCAK